MVGRFVAGLGVGLLDVGTTIGEGDGRFTVGDLVEGGMTAGENVVTFAEATGETVTVGVFVSSAEVGPAETGCLVGLDVAVTGEGVGTASI